MVDATAALYEKAVKALQAGQIDACGALLSKLKVALLELTFLPTDGGISDKEFMLARGVLELGAQWSLKTNESAAERIASFERYIAQLKPYYFDYRTTVPDSAYRLQLIGANLLCLLAQNRIADFHMALETLDPAVLENVYIQHPVQLEQHLMEGAYNKVVLAKNSVPAESYGFFMNVLVDTIRGEIADCCQASYGRLSTAEAGRMLFADAATLHALATERGWQLANGYVTFPVAESAATTVAADKLIERTLHYARELEKIV